VQLSRFAWEEAVVWLTWSMSLNLPLPTIPRRLMKEVALWLATSMEKMYGLT
jgi:hypothetical protein